MFDCDDYFSSGSDESLPPSPIYDRYQSSNRYHVVPPPYTGTFMQHKPDLVFNNAPNDGETDHPTFNVKLSPTKPDNDFSPTYRPSAHIIEDWVSDSEDESKTTTPQNVPSFVQPTEQVKSTRLSVQHVENSIPPDTTEIAILKPTSMANVGIERHALCAKSTLVLITAARPVTTDVLKISVTRPRQAKIVVTKTNSSPRRHINRSSSPKGNRQHALKDKGVIDSGCSRHMTWNMFYLSNFEELNGGYVAFGGNPKSDKISRK
nr:hypothetical protein [Tanacetum cinerariifolium]